MEKKVAIALGIVALVVLLGIITKGKSWPFLVLAGIAYFVYKNNRF